MDSDGFAVQGSRRRRTNRDAGGERTRESFLREVPRYAGRDGSHLPGSLQFPRGSERARRYDEYSARTKPRDNARTRYVHGLGAATEEFEDMNESEQEYYQKHTGGLRPDQHERLDHRAGQYADVTYKNATGRANFLRSFPHGYHSLEDQNLHHGYASKAYGEAEYARGQQSHHQRHRSYKGDPRRDKYNRPMSQGQY